MADQTSDETFLDEMALLLTSDNGIAAMSVEQAQRLVALARRAPALTWQPLIQPEELETWATLVSQQTQRFVGLNLENLAAALLKAAQSLRAPAPPEARP